MGQSQDQSDKFHLVHVWILIFLNRSIKLFSVVYSNVIQLKHAFLLYKEKWIAYYKQYLL